MLVLLEVLVLYRLFLRGEGGGNVLFILRDGVKSALTPCPSPFAKSAPEEGRVLNFVPRNNLGRSPLPERFLRRERGRG